MDALKQHVAGQKWLGYNAKRDVRCEDGHCPVVALALAVLPAREAFKITIPLEDWNSSYDKIARQIGMPQKVADRIASAADLRSDEKEPQVLRDRKALNQALWGKA